MNQEAKNKLVIFDYSNTIEGAEGVYPGLVDQVKELKAQGYQVAIASLAPISEMKAALSQIDAGNDQTMYDLFYPVVGREALAAINAGRCDKMSRATGNAIVDATNANPNQTVVVGDAFTELLMARNNGFEYLHAGWDDRNKTGLRLAMFDGSDIPIDEVDVELAESIPTVDQITLRVEAALEPEKKPSFDPER